MEINKDKWGALHKKTGEDPYQSLEWAEIHEYLKLKPCFIVEEDSKGNYCAGLLYFEQPLKFGFLKSKKLLAEGKPLFLKEKDGEKIIKRFIKKIKIYGNLRPLIAKEINVIKKSKLKTKKEHTVLIDLTKDLDELWKDAQKKSARWGVKKSQKEGVKVSELKNKEELKEFYKSYKETAQAGEFIPVPYLFFEKFYDKMLQKYGQILIAKNNNKVIGGALLLHSKDYIRLRIQASLRDYMPLHPSNALYWAMIEQNKKKGFKFLDLGGYNKSASKNSKSGSVSLFKARFGGKIAYCPTYYKGTTYYYLQKILNIIRKK